MLHHLLVAQLRHEGWAVDAPEGRFITTLQRGGSHSSVRCVFVPHVCLSIILHAIFIFVPTVLLVEFPPLGRRRLGWIDVKKKQTKATISHHVVYVKKTRNQSRTSI
jgi:hypothetical protein